MPPDAIDSFITRLENSGATERANYQMFLSELCDILEVPCPTACRDRGAHAFVTFDKDTIMRPRPFVEQP